MKKRTYLAPKTNIETLRLRGSVLDDPGYARYSDTSDEVHSNTVTFEEENFETSIMNSPNLWDE